VRIGIRAELRSSTLAANGTWTLTSGSGTDTDNTHDNPSYNGNGGYSSADSAGFYGGTISAADAMTNSAHTTVNSSVVAGKWVDSSGGGSTTSSNVGNWTVTEDGDYSIFNYGLNIPMSGTTHDAAGDNWSSGFSTTSTLNSSTGTWATTGSGHTHNYAYDDFNYGGYGSATLSTNTSTGTSIGTEQWQTTSNSTLAEGGLYNQSVDTSTDNWVLDPSGIWRAANTTIISTGDAQSNYTYNGKGSSNTITPLEGGGVSTDTKTGSGTQHEESDYHYSDTLQRATDINNIVTLSGSGSGSGTASGSDSFHEHEIAVNVNGTSYYMNDNADQNSYNFIGGNWTENYATGAVDLGNPVDTVSGTESCVWSYGGSLEGPPPGAYPGDSPGTQNFPGFWSDASSNGYFILPTPSLSYGTAETPDFGRMLPSAPLVEVVSVTARKPPAPQPVPAPAPKPRQLGDDPLLTKQGLKEMVDFWGMLAGAEVPDEEAFGGFEAMAAGDNAAANRSFQFVVNELELSRSQADQLHEMITGEGMSMQEIMEFAKSWFFGE